MVNAAIILAFSSFLGLSLAQPCPHVIIMEIAIRRVRLSNFRGDVVADILSQLTLGSLACVALRRVLLPDIGSSNSYFLDPRQHCLRQALDVNLGWVCGHIEDEWKHNVAIVSDHFEQDNVEWVFGFHQYEYESIHRLIPKYCAIFENDKQYIMLFPNFWRSNLRYGVAFFLIVSKWL